MAQAKSGDTVRVHYTGTLDDASVFDSSESRDPLAFTIGKGEVISGFEQAVVGLNPGDDVNIHIPAAQAYGVFRSDLVAVFPREHFPQDRPLEIGVQLQMKLQDGQVIVVTITKVTETEVTLDANHPLAGKDLNFNIKLVDISN